MSQKDLGKFKSSVTIARNKMNSMKDHAREQYHNWKRVLSGALNDKQLIVALSILFGFYLFFAGFNMIHGGNSRDENTVTCECAVGHGGYYRSLIIITILLWVFFFVIIMILDFIKLFKYYMKRSSQDHGFSSSSSTPLKNTIISDIQAVQTIPVKSVFTNYMVEDVVDEGATTSQNVESQTTKGKQEPPVQMPVKKGMETVDHVVTCRLEPKPIGFVDDKLQSKSAEMTAKSENYTDSILDMPVNMVSGVAANQSLIEANSDEQKSDSAQEPMFTQNTMLNEIAHLPDDGTTKIKQNPTKLMVESLNTEMQSKKRPDTTRFVVGTATELPDSKSQTPEKKITHLPDTPTSKKHKTKSHLKSKHKLSKADVNSLKRLKHYEDYLWFQFYKVYNVGATLEDEDEDLPDFINIIEDDHEEYETSVDDEVKPLVKGKQSKFTKVQNSYDEVNAAEIPCIAIESNENFDTKEHHDIEISTIIIESDVLDDNPDTVHCYAESHELAESTTMNDATTTNCYGTNANTDSTLGPASGTQHPTGVARLSLSNASVKSDATESDEPDGPITNFTDTHTVPVDWAETTEDVLQVTDPKCAQVSFFFYPILVMTRLLTQLALVPLLLFQTLDTYAWICITDDVYCRTVFNQYRLALDRTTLAFTFYFCLLLSILASAMLQWFPCSKYARKANAACIM